jgi:hypothetical protein
MTVVNGERNDQDEIDRWLSAEDRSGPPDGFAERVMARIRREAASPPPLSFPWRRLVAGLAASLVWAGFSLEKLAEGRELAGPLGATWPAVLALGALLSLALLRLVVALR